MDRKTLQGFLFDMLLARAFEERAAKEYSSGNIAGFLHLYPGEEAVAVGVIHAAEPGGYRPRSEVNARVEYDPVKTVIKEAEFGHPTAGEIASAGPDVIAQLITHPSAIDHFDDQHVERIRQQVDAVVEDAVQFAMQSPRPELEDAWASLYCNRRQENLIGESDHD